MATDDDAGVESQSGHCITSMSGLLSLCERAGEYQFWLTSNEDLLVCVCVSVCARAPGKLQVSSRVPAAMKLRLHFVVDPMGWLCISVVFGIWLYNTFFIPKLVLLPHYNEGHIPWAIVVCVYLCFHWINSWLTHERIKKEVSNL